MRILNYIYAVSQTTTNIKITEKDKTETLHFELGRFANLVQYVHQSHSISLCPCVLFIPNTVRESAVE